jgi:hypothetical protein
VEGVAQGPLPLKLHPVLPNPSSGPAAVDLDLPVVERLTLGIYGVSGRLVRSLESKPLAPGRHRLAWDGLAATGQPAAPGLYFLRLCTDRGNEVQKIVILP